MKRIVALLLMLTLCISLASPVYAAGNDFVPSITYKGKPEIVPVVPEDGGEDDKVIIGVVRDKVESPDDKEGFRSYIHEGCLVITPVAEAETSKAIPRESADELLYVYKELSEGRMKLPYEKAEDYKGENMVILELLDGTWLCGGEAYDHDHPAEVAPDGVVFDITFDLGVAPDAKLIVMTYTDGEWEPIVDVQNNGDGTVKCTFEHLCPIAISIANGGPVEETESSNSLLWMIALLAALAGVVAVIVGYKKKKK